MIARDNNTLNNCWDSYNFSIYHHYLHLLNQLLDYFGNNYLTLLNCPVTFIFHADIPNFHLITIKIATTIY